MFGSPMMVLPLETKAHTEHTYTHTHLTQQWATAGLLKDSPQCRPGASYHRSANPTREAQQKSYAQTHPHTLNLYLSKAVQCN